MNAEDRGTENGGTDDRPNPKVVLDLEAAEEVADLIMDEPGTADEDLLDNALAALDGAGARIEPVDQRRAAEGEVVAVEMSPGAAEAVEKLIVDDQPTRRRLLRRVGGRLRAKVKRARRRQR